MSCVKDNGVQLLELKTVPCRIYEICWSLNLGKGKVFSRCSQPHPTLPTAFILIIMLWWNIIKRTSKIKSVGTHLLKICVSVFQGDCSQKGFTARLCVFFYNSIAPWNWQRPVILKTMESAEIYIDKKKETCFVKKSEKVINIPAFNRLARKINYNWKKVRELCCS
jgi:hypothetical protein